MRDGQDGNSRAAVGRVEEALQHLRIITPSPEGHNPLGVAGTAVGSINRVTVTLPDGSRLELPEGATGHEAAAAIGPGLAKAAVAVRVDDEIRDLARRFAAPGPGVSVRTQESDKDAFVWGDPNALKHALAEIIANALNFSPQDTEIVLSQWVADDLTVIAIVDQGPGIAPQQLANALREFHQIDRRHQEQQGMGMGLPLARRLIEVHGGTLEIQSVVGRGTQVTVQLPLVRDS